MTTAEAMGHAFISTIMGILAIKYGLFGVLAGIAIIIVWIFYTKK